MNSPAPLPPVPEADAFRAEFRAHLHSSDERKAALKALGALAGGPTDRCRHPQSAEEAEETPPLPDSLRERWEGLYGRAAVPAAPPWRRRSRAASFLESILSLPAAKWWAGAGLAGAAAAVAFLLFPAGLPVPLSPEAGSGAVVLRGGGGGGGETAAAAAKPSTGPPVRVRAESEAAAAGVVRALREAFPKRDISWLSAEAPAERGAVVLDPGAGTATGPDGTVQPLEAGGPSAVMAVEEADERATSPAR